MSDHQDPRDTEEATEQRNRIIAVAVIGAICVAGFFGVRGFLAGEPPKRQKVVQEIAIVRPPPPPPEEEPPPPPPPEIEEEVDVPEPADEPEPLPSDDPPPLEALGLDAEGGAGTDAFGLIGNRGGRGIVGGGSGSRFRWYAGVLKQSILAHLGNFERIRSRGYSINVVLWLSDSGEVEDVALEGSTGEPDLDIAIEEALKTLEDVGGRPPNGMQNPVRLRIETRL